MKPFDEIALLKNRVAALERENRELLASQVSASKRYKNRIASLEHDNEILKNRCDEFKIKNSELAALLDRPRRMVV